MEEAQIKKIYTLTSLQEGMLFHSLYDGAGSYCEQITSEAIGEIDPVVFEKSLSALFERYDILRTVFLYEDLEQCYQVVLEERKPEFKVIELSGDENDEKLKYIEDYKKEDRKRGFDLSSDVLLRVYLFKTGPGKNTILWSFHHILMDGWCMSILVDDFMKFYGAFREGRSPALENVKQFSEYIEWLQERDWEEAKNYWKKYLDGYSGKAGIPLFAPKTEEAPYRQEILSFTIPENETCGLSAIAKENSLTLNTLVEAVWGVLLQKYNSTQDVVFGSVVSGRPPEIDGIEKMVGLFINTIPLRVRSKSGQSLITLAKELQEAAVEAKQFEFYPLARIQAESDAGQELVSHITVFENYPVEEGIQASGETNPAGFAFGAVEAYEQPHYDLNIMFVPGSRLTVKLAYNASVHPKSFMEKIAGHMTEFIKKVVENPSVCIEEVDFLPPGEKQQLLFDFNSHTGDYPEHLTLHQLFEMQAAKTPDGIAVDCEGDCMTYRELDEKSDGLAMLLRSKGAKDGTAAAVLLDRSLEMAVALLGILKSGAAYVPIDPETPAERVGYILHDCNAAILVTCARYKAKNADFAGEILCADTGEALQRPGCKPGNVSSPGSLANIIYTSGSTGKPKGVMVKHRSLVNYIYSRIVQYELKQTDVTLQLASYSFDGFGSTFYSSLLSGGRLVFLHEKNWRDFYHVKDIIREKGVTFLSVAPAMYKGILEEAAPEDLRSVRITALAADRTSPGLLELSKKMNPAVKLFNEYGPTETTIAVAVHEGLDVQSVSIIGKPIPNNQIYILDTSLRPVSVGTAGEIHIAGAGVSMGYVNNPALTSQKFIPNPFNPGTRMYKTGDLGRWHEDGNIEFLGRMDNQVKIRGFRIELEEIEQVLRTHPSVKEAAVMDRTKPDGSKYLCAYFVPGRDGVSGSQLREFLSGKLPYYMIPAHFVWLERLPMLSNVKVDRQALPEPEMKDTALYEAPAGETEEKLAVIWQEVLGIDKIGVLDNFFDLGGDSIKAIQVSSRLRRYGLQLEIRDIFKHPCIRQLGRHVNEPGRNSEQGSVEGAARLTPIQRWFFEQNFKDSRHFNHAVMLYRAEGFEEDKLRAVLEKIAVHHDALRAVYREGGGNPAQYIQGADGNLPDFSVADLGGGSGHENTVEKLADEAHKSMNLERGPLVKAVLFKTAVGDHLLLVVHHLVIDGISWRILFEDLAAGYAQALDDQEIRLQEKTDSYILWGEKLYGYANSSRIAKDAEYWRRVEAVEIKPLPKDRPVEDRTFMNTARASVRISKEVTGKLLGKVNSAYNTEMNDILLAALGLSVKAWTGDDRVAVWLEGHGREEICDGIDIKRTVGWFTSMYPVLLDMKNSSDTAYLIQSVKEQLRKIPNRGIGYGLLRYMAEEPEQYGLAFKHNPEISFNYLGRFDTDTSNAVFRLSDLPVGQAVGQYEKRPNPLNITAIIAENQMDIRFEYDSNEYKPATMEGLAQYFSEALHLLARHCEAVESPLVTPFDVGCTELSLDEWLGLQIPKSNIEKVYSLSNMQEGMYFHWLYDRSSKAYFQQLALRVKEDIDIRRIEKSIQLLMDRHEVFRTVFIHSSLGKPQQVVLKKMEAGVCCEDISAMDENERDAYMDAFLARDREAGFNLNQGPLIRASVIKGCPEAVWLVFSFHHIVMDGWCIGTVTNEFFGFYHGLGTGKPMKPDNPQPYSVFIEWLQKQDREAGEKYWKAYLDGYEGKALLGRSMGLNKGGGYEHGVYFAGIDSVLVQKLEKIARDNRVTMNSLIEAGWGVLLHKYGNTGDAVFGSVTSGRPSQVEGVENIIGLFINTVPVRVTCEEGQTFAALLRETREKSVASMQYHYFSLAEIQACSAQKAGLIDHILVFENYPAEKLVGESGAESGKGFEIDEVRAFEQTSYDLSLIIIPGERFELRFYFNGNTYSEADVKKLAGHFNRILAEVSENPDILPGKIELLASEEKKRMLGGNEDWKEQYPLDKTIHRLFAEQAGKTPQRTAVVHGNRRITYRELDEKSDRLAGQLLKHGVDNRSLVGIFMERSIDMVVAVLGILKAGAGFVPVDPAYPQERIKFMLEDSGVRILVTKKAQRQEIEYGCVRMDIDELDAAEASGEKTPVPGAPSDLLYVIYTSGTTGTPKGIMLEHKNMVNLVYYQYLKTGVDFSARVLQFTTISFDVCYQEIFTALLAGGELHIADEAYKSDVEKLFSYMNESSIHIVYFPTSFLKFVFQEEEYAAVFPRGIKHIITAGEQLVIPAGLKRYLENNPVCLHNHYGPSETHVVTTYTIKPGDRVQDLPPIGKPIDNNRIYIMDRHGMLMPEGLQGELYIAGENVGRGYTGRPALTAERFLRDPYRPGQRMYKTGDIGRYLPDGNIEFCGRADSQIKIRGYRVEPGEIEKRLLDIAGVREAVVVDIEDPKHTKFLCAYISAEKGMTGDFLKSTLSEVLPGYMIPSAFVIMEKLPLTPNMKIDRKALPMPEIALGRQSEDTKPENETEEKLLRIWREILGHGNFDVCSNFFDIGGHSLKSILLKSRIYREFESEIQLKEIFNHPTIRQLSRVITASTTKPCDKIKPCESREYYRLSSAQKRLYILWQLNRHDTAYNMPCAVMVEGTLCADRIENAFRALIQRHEIFRTSIQAPDGIPVQKIHTHADFTLQRLEIHENDLEDSLRSLVQPFDLTETPMLRAAIIRLAAGRHVLFYDMHHIVSDAVTTRMVMEELVRLYNGEVPEPVALQYKDYSEWQNGLLYREAFKRQQAYWLDLYKGDIPVLNLPTDDPRSPAQGNEGESITVRLQGDVSKGIKELAAKTGTTEYMVLLAAYNLLLSKYTGQEDIIVGTPVAARPHEDLQKIAGMFTNTLALRNFPVGEKTFADFLAEVREHCVEAYMNEEYPFEELVENLELKRDSGRHPLFDTYFVLHHWETGEIRADGLKFTPLELDAGAVKSDLTLNIAREGEDYKCNMAYPKALFRKDTVERLMNHFKNILKQITCSPGIKLQDVDMLAEEEKEWLLYEVNNTQAEYPCNETIAALVSKQAERTPEHIAIEYRNERMTYRELEQKSRQVACALSGKGIGPGSIVGLMGEHSPGAVIGILGVLKAGAAYLPIDASYPEEKISFMLEDSNTAILLVDRDTGCPPEFCGEVVSIESLLKEARGDRMADIQGSGDDLAYIIYTSGSTGRPKGVMVTGRGLVNYIWWAARVYCKGETLSFPLYSSLSFDLTVTSIFTPLVSGGTIVIYNHKDKGALIGDIIRDNRCDIIKLTPTHLKIIEELPMDKLSRVKRLIVGGEDLKTLAARRVFDKFDGKVEIYNEYGPTETVVGCMIHQYDPERDTRLSVPIGVPADNVQLYILDRSLRPQPVGVAGELCISGDGVAKGYLNRPELTQEKFVKNPFADGKIFYRTGDLARWLPGGIMEFLGRMDNQVKIRGFRIEPGEIQWVLAGFKGVKESVVAVKEDGTGEKYLCAYIVPEKESGMDRENREEIRSYLAQRLPEYMVPLHYMFIDSIPMSANGKADLKRLPGPETDAAGSGEDAPAGEVEEKLAALWKEVLGLDHVGTNASFFDLGGQSLKATIVAVRIHKEFGVEMPLSQIFAAPTISGLAEVIRAHEKIDFHSILPVEPREYYETSSAQKRIYIINSLDDMGKNTTYNIPSAYIVEGDLSIPRLEKTLAALVRRYESLRTSFFMDNGALKQQVWKEVPCGLEYFEAAEDGIDNIIGSFVRAFDLQEAPLFRVGLIKLEELKYILICDIHHIISDGISMSVLIKEFSQIYSGLEPEPLRIQYKDFAAWQNSLYKTGGMQKQEQYWLDVFSGELPVLDFPCDHMRPKVQSFEGDLVNFEVGRELGEKLKNLARKTGTTLYMLLLAAYNVLLAKYTAREDIIVGTVAAGRPHPDLENIIGLFVNTLAVRSFPEGEKTFSGFMAEVRENVLKAGENQDYPFEELLEKLHINRDTGRNPLFDTVFILQDTGEKSSDSSEIKIQPCKIEQKTSKFDFMLGASFEDGRLSFMLEFCTKLFERSTIERFAAHFCNLLGRIAENPDTRIADMDILSPGERKLLIEDFNDNRTAYPKSKTIHELFREQAVKAPGKIAVVRYDKTISYRELDEKSDRIAGILKEKGVLHGDIIGILADRSIETIIGILGILKAGCAYLPVDVSYPTERIAYMLRECKTPVLMTAGKTKENIREAFPGVTLLDLCTQDEYSEPVTQKPRHKALSSDLAYVMYTSGSTGNPKGVMVEHKNVIRLVKNTNYISFESGDRILQTGSIAFDASTFEIWGALLNGLTLYFVHEDDILDAARLEEAINSYGITVLWLTSSLFNLLSNANSKIFKGLRYLLVGGDVLAPGNINRVRRDCKDTRIINGYGPTENTTFSVCFNIDREYGNNIPIGKPISNSTAYIVDRYNRPCPAGVYGELLVGGDGVARGYLNNQDVTGEKFIASPFREGERLYRTGDMARWLPGGTIEFHGRMDFQVKIRGYRVELGEIEACLLKYEGVKEALVLLREAHSGDKQLYAYVVPDKVQDASCLRQFVKNLLPEYMVPSHIILLDRLPLNANGKVDRKALPGAGGQKEQAKVKAKPENRMEERIVSIWQKVLNNDDIGIDDNFFEIGGHSLSAAAFTGILQKEMNVKLPLRFVFELPTVRELAGYVNTLGKHDYKEIPPVEEMEYYPVSSAQKRMYILSSFESANPVYHISGAVMLQGACDMDKIEKAVKALIERHEALRTSFRLVDGQLVQKVHPSVDFAVEVMENPGPAADETVRECIHKFIRPFDLSKAPLLRVGIIPAANDRYVMVYDMHHIISDGTSLNIITHEFACLYRGEELKPLRRQYKDFASWQNNLLAARAAGVQEDYWKGVFENGIPLLNMPADFARVPKTDFEGDSLFFSIHGGLAGELNRLAVETGTTLFMLLLAVYNVLLSKYTGQEDIVVGCPVAGRSHPDTGDIVGMFVNTLAIRNHPQKDLTFRGFLKNVKNNVLGAFENQDYQFEDLVDKLNVERDITRTPVFDTMFVMQNIAYGDKKVFGDSAEELRLRDTVAKFDITLEAAETGDGISFKMNYCKNLYKKETMLRFVAHFRNILGLAAGSPSCKLCEFDMLSPNEKEMLLVGFNDTQRRYSDTETIYRLFEAQVEKTPENTAVIYRDTSLTYRELNNLSNRLAAALVKRGARPGAIVGILLERSIEMIVAILGVLKSGAAYLPMSPRQPGERLKFMLDECKTDILISEKSFASGLAFAGELVDISTMELHRSKEYAKNPEVPVLPTDPAYVIYTSGTTGRPKGVLVEHKGICNTIQWRRDEYRLSGSDVVLQLFPYIFDGFMTSFFTPMASGAGVVLLSEDDSKNAVAIAKIIPEKGITHFISVPQLYEAVLELLDEESGKSLRMITLAGDRMGSGIVEKSRAVNKKLEIINEYGPTECSVAATFARNVAVGRENVIGRPIGNTKIYILDGGSRLQPVGVPGELCISGEGLARGYISHPELTAEKFVKNPFAEDTLMYRTGDLARWLPDGNIEFLGRMDNQIKIRGFRIEPGEIEALISGLNGIESCVVLEIPDKFREKHLCAYFAGSEKINPGSLREYLAGKLPEYMIPSFFIRVDGIPLTANGKVDKNALPDPWEAVMAELEYTEPKKETEKNIAGIWEQILGIDKIGIHHNFFDLGGNSLRLLQMHAKIQQLYPDKLQVMDLFAYPTVKKLAEVIESRSALHMQAGCVKLPDEFFAGGTAEEPPSQFRFTIGKELVEGLRAVSNKEKTSIDNIFAALFAYLLSDITECAEVVIQAASGKMNFVSSVALDMKKINSVSALFEATAIGMEKAKGCNIEMLEGMKQTREGHSVLPLIYNRRLLSYSRELTEIFDITAGYTDSNDGILFTFGYRPGLKAESIKGLAEKYAKIIEMTIGQYE